MPTRFLLRIVLVLTLLVTLGYTGAVGCLWINQSRIIFSTGRSLRQTRPLDATIFGPVRLRTPDGVGLEAATLRAEGDAGGRAYWILFCPPSAGSINRARLQGQLLQLREFGYNVFAFDYRGFGHNQGVPTEAGLYEDAQTAYRHLTKVLGVPADRVILAGQSLGSAVAVEMATRIPAAGLLLLSPIDSVPLTGARLYPWAPVRLLVSHQFDSLSKIDRVRGPVVIVHAVRDRLIPISAARALFDRVPGSKLMIEAEGTHNSAGFTGGTALREALATFW